MENQKELTKKIQEIYKNEGLSMQEKSKEVQKLFSTYKEKKISDINIICNHYDRNCDIIAFCCKKKYPCRLCHDENEDHNMDRKKTENIVCRKCNLKQVVSNKCQQCNIVFGEYYCKECRLWINNSDKDYYHCNKCGICRVGKGIDIDFFHCDICNACLPISLKNNHKCINNTMQSKCPICNEDIFSSTSSGSILKCGHSIHQKCLTEYLKHNYICPLCKKSICDMEEYWKKIDEHLENYETPEEYKEWKSEILCNDCEKQSITSFNLMYHKCKFCNGYNTNIINTIQE
tara:strand:+ start:567 stop:1433 length:867 start_codon:yes stop_codon:yes gene_type:complete